MHSYSVDSNIRTTITSYVAVISIALMFIVGIVLKFFSIDFIPLEINIQTIGFVIFKMFTVSITIFGVIYYLYDNFLWKTSILHKVHKIPNLNGSWNGSFLSSKLDDNGVNYNGTSEMVIKQTWSKISITAYFNKSTSDSHSARININGNDGIELKFEYYNKAEQSVIPTMMKHTGFNILRYISSENKLVGDYFTDKNRSTNGTITVIKVA